MLNQRRNNALDNSFIIIARCQNPPNTIAKNKSTNKTYISHNVTQCRYFQGRVSIFGASSLLLALSLDFPSIPSLISSLSLFSFFKKENDTISVKFSIFHQKGLGTTQKTSCITTLSSHKCFNQMFTYCNKPHMSLDPVCCSWRTQKHNVVTAGKELELNVDE